MKGHGHAGGSKRVDKSSTTSHIDKDAGSPTNTELMKYLDAVEEAERLKMLYDMAVERVKMLEAAWNNRPVRGVEGHIRLLRKGCNNIRDMIQGAGEWREHIPRPILGVLAAYVLAPTMISLVY